MRPALPRSRVTCAGLGPRQVSRTGAEERLTRGRPDSSSPCHRQAVHGPSGWGHQRVRNRRQGLAFGPMGFLMAQRVKTPPAVPETGDGLDPWVREIPRGGRNGNPLHYACLKSPVDGSLRATVRGAAKGKGSDTVEDSTVRLNQTRR